MHGGEIHEGRAAKLGWGQATRLGSGRGGGQHRCVVGAKLDSAERTATVAQPAAARC